MSTTAKSDLQYRKPTDLTYHCPIITVHQVQFTVIENLEPQPFRKQRGIQREVGSASVACG